MIEIKRLEANEYEALRTIDDGYCPEPSKSIALIASNEHMPIGRLFVVAPAHVEGIYIAHAWRGGSVFKDLMDAAEIEARSEGITKLLAYAIKPEIGHYIERRCGYQQLPWTVWQKDLTCQ